MSFTRPVLGSLIRSMLRIQQPFYAVPERVPVQPRNGVCQQDAFGADFNAVLCIAALGDAAIIQKRLISVVFYHSTCGMHVKQKRLGDYRRPYKIGSFIYLRAGFHTYTAAHAS